MFSMAFLRCSSRHFSTLSFRFLISSSSLFWSKLPASFSFSSSLSSLSFFFSLELSPLSAFSLDLDLRFSVFLLLLPGLEDRDRRPRLLLLERLLSLLRDLLRSRLLSLSLLLERLSRFLSLDRDLLLSLLRDRSLLRSLSLLLDRLSSLLLLLSEGERLLDRLPERPRDADRFR